MVYISTPHASMAWCSVKVQGQLYLYFTLSVELYSAVRLMNFIIAVLSPYIL